MMESNTLALPVQLPQTVAGAFEVLANMYSTGEDRKRLLKEAGYDPDAVQHCVNDLIDLIKKYT